jgi:tetratricopeptide (TPR) repeat protein
MSNTRTTLRDRLRQLDRQVAGICIALAVLTLAVFGQTVTHEFINFDDGDYVTNNPVVKQGVTVRGIIAVCTHAYSANWHPLTWISHMVDCNLFGLNPAGHHLTNVVIHTAAVILLFLVLRGMTGATWRSAFVAAVFAIHPLRVESVAWVAERKDVLSGLFFVLTIGAYARYARAKTPARYGLVALLFLLGLASKPMLVTLPLVLLLLDYWPLRRTEPVMNLVLEKLPLLALSVVSCGITLLVQRQAMKPIEAVPLMARVINAVLTCKTYLVQMVYPARLGLFYPFPMLTRSRGLEFGLLLAVICVLVWKERRRQPWLVVGWVWYLVMLVPVIGIVQVGSQSHADRYTYLPQIGIYLALTWLGAELCAKWQVAPRVVGGVMAAVVVVLAACAFNQTTYWQNSETIWTHTLNSTTGNKLAYMNLGHELLNRHKLDQAYALYQEALKLDPKYPEFHNNLGNVLRQQGKLDQAIVEYQKAVQYDPRFADAEYNTGKILAQMNRPNEAIEHYEKAIEIQPKFALALTSLGTTLAAQGRTTEAIGPFERALEVNPNDFGAHMNLSYCLLQLGRPGEAVAEDEKALALKPDDPEVKNNLAWILASNPDASVRNGSRAVDLARQAVSETSGENAMILHTLAAALAEAGQFSDALETANQALQLAETQSNDRLVKQLQLEMNYYKTGRAFHTD